MALQQFEQPAESSVNVSVESRIFRDHEDAAFYVGVVAEPGEILRPDEYRAVRQFRANVYIDEKGFLTKKARQRDGGETDRDDARSVQFAVFENMGPDEPPRVVGTSRLILKRSRNDLLPVERMYPEAFRGQPAAENSAEASRFIARHPDQAKQRAISLALIRAMTAWTMHHTRQPVYAMVEKPLTFMFDVLRLPYEEVPGSVSKLIPEYRTENRAIQIDPESVYNSIQPERHLQAPRMAGFFKTALEDGGMGYYDNRLVENVAQDIFSPSRAKAVERNLGFLSKREQLALSMARVAIAGAGGDGGRLAETLARYGVGHIRLADPDVFERENINRQAGCTEGTVGRNKAEVIADLIRSINPAAKVVVYNEGITPSNYVEFVEGTDLLIDESEFTRHVIGVALARAARRYGIPNMHALNIGFGAAVTSYDPRGHYTLEDRLGLPRNMPLNLIEQQEVPVTNWLADIPAYGDMRVFEAVAAGRKSAPSVAGGVEMAAGIASTQALLHLLGESGNNRPEPVYAPHVQVMDAMSGQSRIVKHPRARLAASFTSMKWRNKFRLNPRASYGAL